MTLHRDDTIFALSSGLPPAGIAVVRISGSRAGAILDRLAGKRPAPRRASYRALRGADGAQLDQALILWLPGPATATGEDLVEFHLHGGRAVVAAVLEAIGAINGIRAAQAGEFTRRAFENGRIDLAEAEGLADLLAAETESQRRSALAMAEGGLGKRVAAWQAELLAMSAQLEAELDFSDEGDVSENDTERLRQRIYVLVEDMTALFQAPGVERLRDGITVALGGPTNSGKSSIFNALIDREAAIVSDIAGTTRDRIEAPIALDGVPFLFIDTAGLRDSDDAIESIGVARARDALSTADLILWLGDADDAPKGALQIAAKSDLGKSRPIVGLPVSARTGEGLVELKETLLARARGLLPKPGALALNHRHRSILAETFGELEIATRSSDPLIIAEHFRNARNHLDRLTGRAGVEDMLDALFGGLCIGK